MCRADFRLTDACTGMSRAWFECARGRPSPLPAAASMFACDSFIVLGGRGLLRLGGAAGGHGDGDCGRQD